MILMARKNRIVKIAKALDPRLKPLGEATGIVKFAAKDAKELRRILARFAKKGIVHCEYEDAYTELMKTRALGHEPVGDVFWSEMDFEEDLRKIESALKRA
jgi:choline kinase